MLLNIQPREKRRANLTNPALQGWIHSFVYRWEVQNEF
jgi:hypothetical protein